MHEFLQMFGETWPNRLLPLPKRSLYNLFKSENLIKILVDQAIKSEEVNVSSVK